MAEKVVWHGTYNVFMYHTIAKSGCIVVKDGVDYKLFYIEGVVMKKWRSLKQHTVMFSQRSLGCPTVCL